MPENRSGVATDLCEPFICDFPTTKGTHWMQRWTCPRCGTTYSRGMRIPEWTTWLQFNVFRLPSATTAPHGYWALPFRSPWRPAKFIEDRKCVREDIEC